MEVLIHRAVDRWNIAERTPLTKEVVVHQGDATA